MTKADLIKTIAKKAGLSQKDTKNVLDAFQESIIDVVKADDSINLPGFGVFKAKAVAEHTGRNPATGEAITVPAHKKFAFNPSSSIKSF